MHPISNGRATIYDRRLGRGLRKTRSLCCMETRDKWGTGRRGTVWRPSVRGALSRCQEVEPRRRWVPRALPKGIWRHDLTLDKASHSGSGCKSAEMPGLGGTHPCPTVLTAFRAILKSIGKTGTKENGGAMLIDAIFSHAADRSGLKADWEGKTRFR